MGSLAMKVVVAMCLACALAVDARGGPSGCTIANCKECKNGACKECSKGYYLDTTTGTCQLCTLAGCKECAAGGTTCRECNKGYGRDSSGACVACPANCRECYVDVSGAATCKECNTAYGVNLDDGTCVSCSTAPSPCTNLKCFSSAGSLFCPCPKPATGSPATGYDPATGTCISCPTNCKKCALASTCQECGDRFGLDGTGGCAACSDAQCKDCKLSASSCRECNQGYWYDTSSSTCTACITNCKRCSDGTTCLECKRPYRLNADKTACA